MLRAAPARGGWTSSSSGASWDEQRRALISLQSIVPRPGARCRSRRSGSRSGRCSPGRQRAPRLSWTWKSTTESRTGSTIRVSDVRRRPAITLAWPMSRQSPTAGEAMRRASERSDERIGGDRLRAGEDGRQVLQRDRDAEALGGRRQARERARLGEQPVLGSGAVRDRAGVVDDALGPALGGVGERSRQSADRRVRYPAISSAGAWRTRRSPGGRASATALEWRMQPRASISTDSGGDGSWTHEKPDASISLSIGADGHHSCGTLSPSRESRRSTLSIGEQRGAARSRASEAAVKSM